MAELAMRRARRVGSVACALSVAAHGTGLVLLVVLAHATIVAAPFEPVPIALVVDEPPAPETAIPTPEPPAQAPPAHAPSRRRPSVRAAVVEPPPEPPAPPPPEPPAPPPPEPSAPPVAPPPSAPAAVPSEPAVEPDVARALRVFDAFPTLPEQAARARPVLDFRVCVSTQGAVSDAVIVRGPADPSSETLRAAILRWRYRPFAPEGTPTPFCHLMRISYRTN